MFKKVISRLLATLVIGTGLVAMPAVAGNGPAGKPSVVAERKATLVGTPTIQGTQDQCSSRITVTMTATLTGTTDDGGGNDTVYFSIWDDGAEMGAVVVQIPVGQTQTISRTISYVGTIGTSADGLGAYIGEDSGFGDLIEWDPYYPTLIACSVPTTSATGLLGLLALLPLVVIYSARRRKLGVFSK